MAQEKHALKIFQPLPKYPPNIVDLSILVPESTTAGGVQTFIQGFNQKGWLRSVNLVDIYRNSKKYPDQKSVSFTLEYRSEQGSLSSKHVEKEMKKHTPFVEKTVKNTSFREEHTYMHL